MIYKIYRHAHALRIEPVKDKAYMKFILDRPVLNSKTEGPLYTFQI